MPERPGINFAAIGATVSIGFFVSTLLIFLWQKQELSNRSPQQLEFRQAVDLAAKYDQEPVFYACGIAIAGLAIGLAIKYARKNNSQQKTHLSSLKQIWNELSAPLVLLDSQLNLVYANQSFANLIGQPTDTITKMRLTDLLVDINGRHFLGNESILKENSLAKEMLAFLIPAKASTAPRVVRFSIKWLPAEKTLNASTDTVLIGAFQDLSSEYALTTIRQQLWQIIGTLVRSHLTLAQELVMTVGSSSSERTSQETQHALRLVHQESSRLERLIVKLVQTEGLDLSKMPFSYANTTSTELIEKSVKMTQTHALKFDTKIVVQDAKLSIRVDPDAIVQVLINLLSNAISYSPPGSTVTIRAFQSGSHTRFEIEDSGPGIKQNEEEALFDRFQRGTGHRPNEKGLGLGLALCKQLVEGHGGTISTTAAPGGGSIFFFNLP